MYIVRVRRRPWSPGRDPGELSNSQLVVKLKTDSLQLRSVHFYLLWDKSAHPIRLLSQVLSHPTVREVLEAAPKDEGLKMHAENIKIETYPGYVILSALLRRIKTQTGEVNVTDVKIIQRYPCR